MPARITRAVVARGLLTDAKRVLAGFQRSVGDLLPKMATSIGGPRSYSK